MANSDKRFLYTDDDGMLIIMCPADKTDLTLDEIKINIVLKIDQSILLINL